LHEAIVSFLVDPTLDDTDWRAEHALRPAVVNRKMWRRQSHAPSRRQPANNSFDRFSYSSSSHASPL
jgi:hypothetical protein